MCVCVRHVFKKGSLDCCGDKSIDASKRRCLNTRWGLSSWSDGSPSAVTVITGGKTWL